MMLLEIKQIHLSLLVVCKEFKFNLIIQLDILYIFWQDQRAVGGLPEEQGAPCCCYHSAKGSGEDKNLTGQTTLEQSVLPEETPIFVQQTPADLDSALPFAAVCWGGGTKAGEASRL